MQFLQSIPDVTNAGPGSVLVVVLILLYFLPAIIGRKKRTATAIFVFNLLLGTTVVCWIIALVWALTPDPQQVVVQNISSEPSSPPAVTANQAPKSIFAILIAGLLWSVLLIAGIIAWNYRSGGSEATDKTAITSPSPSPTVSPAVNIAVSPTVEPTKEAVVIASSADQQPSASDILDVLKKAGLPIMSGVVYTEETDPNHLLGRPGQYISKASWRDSRDDKSSENNLNYTVEVFATDEALQRRKKYTETVAGSISFLAEYQFVHGQALLRLHHFLTPAQAAEYEKVFKEVSAVEIESPRTITASYPTALPTATPCFEGGRKVPCPQ